VQDIFCNFMLLDGVRKLLTRVGRVAILGILSHHTGNKMITKEQATEALDNLEDYSLLECSINPIGAVKTLLKYIEQMEDVNEAAEEIVDVYNTTQCNTKLYAAVDRLESLFKGMK
jgi:fatty acid-binding protein DegV